MARPSKTVSALKQEKKSHRTKAELEQREKAEKALVSGIPCFERKIVKENSIAHKEYLRVAKLMKKIDKFDAIFGAGLNRYCENFAKYEEYNCEILDIKRLENELENKFDKLQNLDFEQLQEYGKMMLNFQKQRVEFEKLRKSMHKELEAFEKENGMTVQSVLRCIPKNPDKNEINPLLAALKDEEE